MPHRTHDGALVICCNADKDLAPIKFIHLRGTGLTYVYLCVRAVNWCGIIGHFTCLLCVTSILHGHGNFFRES
jgi:hypothetical protein